MKDSIMDRLSNSWTAGGLTEIGRKAFYYALYKWNNIKTRKTVMRSEAQYGLRTEQGSEKYIVSLTSYPKRFAHIGLCLKSLICQTIKPDRIIVYLGSDSQESDLTEEMLSFKQYGIEYRFDPEKNLKPHKKYFYAMQEFPDANIVTADDDVIYPTDWLESFMKVHQLYPHAICARRVHLMRMDDQGTLMPYNLWFNQYRKKSNAIIFANCHRVFGDTLSSVEH